MSSSTEVGDATVAAGEEPPRNSAPLCVPRVVRDSYATSSSDGSPVEKLSAALEAMGIHRGRLRTRSPTPARDTPPSASVEAPDWASALSAGEKMLFHAPVEETALKRRTSRLLLPLPVSQRKPKLRELTLTSHRLLCLKPLKNGRGVGIKAEFGLREAQAPLTGREKRSKGDEVRGMITGVERKSAKEFVVMTTGKSAFFVVENEAAADAWVRRIAEALQQHSTQNRERKQSNNNSNSNNNNNNCSPRWISNSLSFASRSSSIFVPVNVTTTTTTTTTTQSPATTTTTTISHSRTRTRTRTASAASSTPISPEPANPPPPPLLSSLPPLFFSSIPRRMRQASKGVNSVHE